MTGSNKLLRGNGDSKDGVSDVKFSVSSTSKIVTDFFLTTQGNLLPPSIVSTINEYCCIPLTKIEKYKNQPNVVADICLAHLRDTESNGVALALDVQTLEVQKTLLDAWRQCAPNSDDYPSHTLLCAYYSHRDEWRELNEVIKKYIDQANNSALEKCPPALIHAVIIKYYLNSSLSDFRKSIIVENLLKMSTAYLNLKGCKLGRISFPQGYVLQDVHLGDIDFIGVTMNMALKNVYFKGSKFLGGDFTAAILDKKAQHDIVHYYDTDSGILESREHHLANAVHRSVSTLADRLISLSLLSIASLEQNDVSDRLDRLFHYCNNASPALRQSFDDFHNKIYKIGLSRCSLQ